MKSSHCLASLGLCLGGRLVLSVQQVSDLLACLLPAGSLSHVKPFAIDLLDKASLRTSATHRLDDISDDLRLFHLG